MAKKCCKSSPPCKSCPKLKKRKKSSLGDGLKIARAYPLIWLDEAC